MIHIFEQSFYAGYFMHLPEHIIASSLEQVHRNMRNERYTCPHLFEEIFELKAALFLKTFFGTSELCYKNNDGKVVAVTGMDTSGAKSTVKRDSVDSSVSREYFKPEFMPGEDPTDFPLGYLKNQLALLEKECEDLNTMTMGFGANLPCGYDPCGSMELFTPKYNTVTTCKGCRNK